MPSRFFLDTAPLIYFLDKSSLYFEKMKHFIFKSATEDSQFYTSVITDMEYSVIPYRNDNKKKLDNYYAFQNYLGIKKIDINTEIANYAGFLRSKYDFLKGLDALQLASAHFYECDFFVTNDKSLLQVQEIKNSLLVSNM
ncbi:MAG: PIN domain-containing protein [Treponemataceae bacterium]|nr:PIN domain-containing protein [Treponemataceae bacterium]